MTDNNKCKELYLELESFLKLPREKVIDNNGNVTEEIKTMLEKMSANYVKEDLEFIKIFINKKG